MAIKFVDKESGEGEPEAKPAKAAIAQPAGEDEGAPAEHSGASPLPHAKPTPKKRGRK